MTTTTYRIAPAPKFAALYEWDCSRCGRREVKPVFLNDGTGAKAYGSGCAARLLGRPEAARKIRVEFDAVQRAAEQAEEMRVERTERYGRALKSFELDPNVETPELLSARRTYHQSGGFPVLGTFPAWMARVAETGELDRIET